jgi:hypothetical protein
MDERWGFWFALLLKCENFSLAIFLSDQPIAQVAVSPWKSAFHAEIFPQILSKFTFGVQSSMHLS